MFLGTPEQGKVLKVLHTLDEAFIISQFSLFHNEGPVLSMAIDSQKVKKLFLNLTICDVCNYGDIQF